MLRKDVPSLEEIQSLINCHYENENPTVRRAFIFCLYCGLRFCDVKDLTCKNVDYSNKLLKFEQNKAKGHSSASEVVIPLNDGLYSLLLANFLRMEIKMCLFSICHLMKVAVNQ